MTEEHFQKKPPRFWMLFTRQIMTIGIHLTTKKKLLQNDAEYRLYKCQHGLETSASEKRKNQSENYWSKIIFHFQKIQIQKTWLNFKISSPISHEGTFNFLRFVVSRLCRIFSHHITLSEHWTCLVHHENYKWHNQTHHGCFGTSLSCWNRDGFWVTARFASNLIIPFYKFRNNLTKKERT